MKLDHTAIWVMDLEMEKEFFLKYFDCSTGDKYVNAAKKFSSYFITFSGGGRIELMNREGIPDAGRKEAAGYSHIAINTGSRESVDKITENLKKDGITIESAPRETGDGYYESVILDPESNRIEIVSE